MEIPGDRDDRPQRPLKHPRARRAIGAALGTALVGYVFAAPIIQAKPQDRPATAIVIGLVALIVAFLILPTQINNWYERRNRR